MKTTYLVRMTEGPEAGSLRLATGEEWFDIVKRNKELPPDQQRYFITDNIVDNGTTDRMLIEVDYPVYKEWHKSHQASLRNLKAKQAFLILSLDEIAADTEGLSLADTISSGRNLEELVNEALFMEHVYSEVRTWYPWATDLLDALINKNWHHCTHEIAVKYKRSDRAIQTSKKNFLKKLKIFLKGLRF